ncbi:MAG: hypothetical protein VKP62_05505 [Candidatus Sericytochromatia bacterium]|nr:hypothetical protein [Candidatus Sericytochromatia bacterium]
MNLASPTATAPVPSEWNWRAELVTLDAAIDHVSSCSSWDWRKALLEIEAELESLASRVFSSSTAS